MLEHAVIVVVILLFVSFSIPIIGALWKIFALKQGIEQRIKETAIGLKERIDGNTHRLDLLEQRGEHLLDQQATMINGYRETLTHVRERSAKAEEQLEHRIADVERFLEKTTAFNPRHS